MTRQCLYCAKEITKSSASNFCSKECWTEYKKLKAFNVGADKQATVMLKKSELNLPSDQVAIINPQSDSAPTPTPSSQPNPTPQRSASISHTPPPTGRVEIKSISTEIPNLIIRVDNLEKLVKDKLTELAHKEIQAEPAVALTSNIDFTDLVNRVTKLELTTDRIDELIRILAKLEDRTVNLEKKLRDKGAEKEAAKKGFFARIFG
jgi:hypothetical protein